MKKSGVHWYALAGGAAGLVNGFFGGGGGMVLVPLLAENAVWTSAGLSPLLSPLSHRCAPCPPPSTTSGAGLDPKAALPYLAGGLVGGLVGGKVFKKLSMVWLRRVFALLILYGGVRALL